MNPARHASRLAGLVLTPLIETVFPSSCWATDSPTRPRDLGLSPEARDAIARGLTFPYCIRCGMTTGPYTNHRRANPCPHCPRRNLGVATVARVGTFDPPLSNLVKRLKFRHRWELAALVAPFLLQAIAEQAEAHALKVDALIPVPLHWRRRVSRGFNQAEELARAVAVHTRWPVIPALRRIRPTHEQSLTQSLTERRDNLASAFAARPNLSLAGKHVWLIDDVCTTGATLHAAALALKRLPAPLRPARLHAAVLCITDKTPVPL